MGMMPPPEEEGMMGMQDATDDMLGDVEGGDDMGGMDDMGGDDEMGGDMDMGMGGEEELGDRLDDLESELEALRDEFESLMGDEGDEEGDDMGGMDDMGGEEEPDMGDEDQPLIYKAAILTLIDNKISICQRCEFYFTNRGIKSLQIIANWGMVKRGRIQFIL